MPKPLQQPEQELRFTRTAQAIPYWCMAAVLLAAAIILLATSFCRDVNPALPHALWSLLPALGGLAAGRLAFRMTRHAYLILTPMGIEIIPWWRPQHGMRVLYWQQIAEAEVNGARTLLTMHFDEQRSGGVHLSLKPIPKKLRGLLMRAIGERVPSAGGGKK